MPEETVEVVVVPVGQRGRVKVDVRPFEITIVVCAAAVSKNAAASRRAEGVNCILTA
jgi:hypothetical protein